MIALLIYQPRPSLLRVDRLLLAVGYVPPLEFQLGNLSQPKHTTYSDPYHPLASIVALLGWWFPGYCLPQTLGL
jgi:hypothetical protein